MSDVTSPIPVGKHARTAKGYDIHYHEAGAGGDPIVFIHGAGPGASGYSNFKRNYPFFAEQCFRAIVPDLPGYGLSSKPEDVAYTLDFLSRPCAAFSTRSGSADASRWATRSAARSRSSTRSIIPTR